MLMLVFLAVLAFLAVKQLNISESCPGLGEPFKPQKRLVGMSITETIPRWPGVAHENPAARSIRGRVMDPLAEATFSPRKDLRSCVRPYICAVPPFNSRLVADDQFRCCPVLVCGLENPVQFGFESCRGNLQTFCLSFRGPPQGLAQPHSDTLEAPLRLTAMPKRTTVQV
ncbi:hypothetical protein C8R46DRAFT_46479 [Mycena filopes]|nr:hypothetical protein C8R46DRAFT_46479 [Mycena filopes]